MKYLLTRNIDDRSICIETEEIVFQMFFKFNWTSNFYYATKMFLEKV